MIYLSIYSQKSKNRLLNLINGFYRNPTTDITLNKGLNNFPLKLGTSKNINGDEFESTPGVDDR